MSCVDIGTLSERDSGPTIMSRQSQDIAVRQIHPRKLSTLLKSRFGPGEYEICVVQNVYSIRAPGRLSLDDIMRCRI
ncbi:hypothetical protein F5883DRAFT_556568 [Diaporthe sp. PMI_573]|nr:hypothetical protein F5883DRAFT_556568 [Diaporthaceae sp. PMI_573]